MRFEVPEGATPIDDAEGLIPMVLTMPELNAVEAENIMKAAAAHFVRRKSADAAWLDEPFVRKLHRDMFGDVWDWAGDYRRTALTIGVAPAIVAEKVGALMGDFRFWHEHPDENPVLERAVRLHHRLVEIHPFRNGNGRHARMMSDLYLHSQGHGYPQWPSDLVSAGEARREYLAGLKAADGGDYEPLVGMARRLIPEKR